MKNTGIVYDSAEKTPVILPELADLLPPLEDEQLSLLEEDIRENGCYSPIVVNEELAIVDGHNRFALCEKLGVPYRMAVFHFEDTLDAMRWALDTQKGRRNLDIWDLGRIALKLKPELEARGKANMSAGGGDQKSREARQRVENPAMEQRAGAEDETESGWTKWSNPILEQVDTRQQLADAVGVGRSTMNRIIHIDEHAPQAVKDALDKKEISVSQGYNITRQLQEVPEEERERTAEIAIADEKMRKKLRKSDEETDRRFKIAGQFGKAFEKSFEVNPTEENIGYWVDCSRMRTREIKLAIDEARELSQMYASIERTLRKLYPEASEALDEEDRSIREEAKAAETESGGDE